MSTLQVDSVAGRLGGTSVVLMDSVMKAAVGEYNQATPAAQMTVNISSITDVAAGQSTDNFTNSFGAADYGIVGSHSSSANPVGMNWATGDDKTTALADMRARNANAGTFSDSPNQNRVYYGDLA